MQTGLKGAGLDRLLKASLTAQASLLWNAPVFLNGKAVGNNYFQKLKITGRWIETVV
ncbi:hypothetical protein [Thalassobacillus devorans]|uniref:hypothetical protein n=1 Tax=Thalassobacillus devorans TaxID=279813 RepID=UPI00141BCBB5|nr:hypothetical protein [Thalassobacillus devorans]